MKTNDPMIQIRMPKPLFMMLKINYYFLLIQRMWVFYQNGKKTFKLCSSKKNLDIFFSGYFFLFLPHKKESGLLFWIFFRFFSGQKYPKKSLFVYVVKMEKNIQKEIQKKSKKFPKKYPRFFFGFYRLT